MSFTPDPDSPASVLVGLESINYLFFKIYLHFHPECHVTLLISTLAAK
jgi:hypothetical protein